jgi:hypothetical protein
MCTGTKSWRPKCVAPQFSQNQGGFSRRGNDILLSAKLMSQNLPFPADGGKTSERIERTEVQQNLPADFSILAGGRKPSSKGDLAKKRVRDGAALRAPELV